MLSSSYLASYNYSCGSCSVTYTCLAGATRPHFHGRTGPGSGFQQGMASHPLLLFVMEYKLGRIYARTNAAFVDRRGLGSRLHAQTQSLPGDPQCYFLSQLGLGTRLCLECDMVTGMKILKIPKETKLNFCEGCNAPSAI